MAQGPTSCRAIADKIERLQAQHAKRLAEMRAKHEKDVKELKSKISERRATGGESEVLGFSRRQPSGGELFPTTEPEVEVYESPHFMQQKEQFIQFVKGVEKGTDSPEFKALYHFLLKCFTDADNNFDGQLGFKEFEVLIETAAALPRRFGYAPSTPEMYNTEWDRLQQRLALFHSLVPKRNDNRKPRDEAKYISFDIWLEYAINHIREKASKLNEIDMISRMTKSKEDFKDFIIAACSSRQTKEYKELYNFVLQCFTEADSDLDGRIDGATFDSLVDKSAEAPRLFGFAPPASETYATEADKVRARAEIFASLDKDNFGYIDFDTWLHYIYHHVCEKTASLGESGIVPEILQASAATGTSVHPRFYPSMMHS